MNWLGRFHNAPADLVGHERVMLVLCRRLVAMGSLVVEQ